MNRIQLVGKIDKKKHKILLGSRWHAELLLPPSSNEISDIADGQYVQVIGDMFGHPAKDKAAACVIRAAIINPFPGDKEAWASGTITLSNCAWEHSESFSTPSMVLGITESRDRIWVKMPLLESRWVKKNGGIIMACGSVDLEVGIYGASKLECLKIISDNTHAKTKGEPPQKISECESLNWHDKQEQEKNNGAVKRRSLSPRMRRKVFLRDGFKCQECGASPGKDRRVWLEVDHIFPVAKGGSNDMSNLRTLCDQCNNGKGTDPAFHHSSNLVSEAVQLEVNQ
jgi:hypothetical protein